VKGGARSGGKRRYMYRKEKEVTLSGNRPRRQRHLTGKSAKCRQFHRSRIGLDSFNCSVGEVSVSVRAAGGRDAEAMR